MAGASADRALLFFHVPKAGGTALAGALGNRFAADECLSIYHGDDPDDAAINAARYVRGHLSLSILDRFERPPFSLTVLRDPIERSLSMYSYMRELENPRTNRLGLQRYETALALAKQHSIDEFIQAEPDLAEHYLGNWQARMLGAKSLDGTDEKLDDALAGLERCDFIGLAERLDESVDWLTRRLGWARLTPLPRANITRTRLRRDQVSPAAIDALLELTSVDRELYAEAVRLYERRLAEWESSADAGDGEAGLADAPLVSDLNFADPIRGAGWLGREPAATGPRFCWIGSNANATVELAGDGSARSLEIEIPYVVDPSILDTLRLSVNGREVPHRLAKIGHGFIVTAPLKRRLRRGGDVTRVELSLDHATRPGDVNRGSSDYRELTIAVTRILLKPR